MINLSDGQSLFASLYLFCFVSRDNLNKKRSLISNQPVRAVYFVARCRLYREIETEERDRLEFIL